MPGSRSHRKMPGPWPGRVREDHQQSPALKLSGHPSCPPTSKLVSRGETLNLSTKRDVELNRVKRLAQKRLQASVLLSLAPSGPRGGGKALRMRRARAEGESPGRRDSGQGHCGSLRLPEGRGRGFRPGTRPGPRVPGRQNVSTHPWAR